MLIFTTDNVSALDVVLNGQVKGKGEVLTTMTVKWDPLMREVIPTHLVAHGALIKPYIAPEVWRDLVARESLIRHALVVKKLKVLPVEVIVRGDLTGSGRKDYQATGMVCGIPLPPGLHDGSELPEPICTPSTKAVIGDHDENISFARMVRDHRRRAGHQGA